MESRPFATAAWEAALAVANVPTLLPGLVQLMGERLAAVRDHLNGTPRRAASRWPSRQVDGWGWTETADIDDFVVHETTGGAS